MSDLALNHFSRECCGDVVLPNNLIESLGPVFAVKSLVMHSQEQYSVHRCQFSVPI